MRSAGTSALLTKQLSPSFVAVTALALLSVKKEMFHMQSPPVFRRFNLYPVKDDADGGGVFPTLRRQQTYSVCPVHGVPVLNREGVDLMLHLPLFCRDRSSAKVRRHWCYCGVELRDIKRPLVLSFKEHNGQLTEATLKPKQPLCAVVLLEASGDEGHRPVSIETELNQVCDHATNETTSTWMPVEVVGVLVGLQEKTPGAGSAVFVPVLWAWPWRAACPVHFSTSEPVGAPHVQPPPDFHFQTVK